ncbi:bifunctional 2-polyprenyl-6-hydroxyphenol methylase/3-demethylubiquinol 3-O-methyltransferase UbiG [Chroococcidiopsis sp. CCNUC1]|uniref:class I SAM-dependent methyltransferase n=1 Tax=Chroococcidiopsis sp. CCNUC1 TaxID=2653189 RepID=UPI002021E30D|nr:class I SAM-dependent methyltransferase [Chroococcidiopsis sp. CCNUC1]URD52876.1 class I SAM-dependent methyltransferase [Chroococcidiopsis sp. CCNUC1]
MNAPTTLIFPTNLVETEEISACPNCSSKKLELWCRAYDRQHKSSQQEFIYSRCKECNLVFLSVRPVETEVYKFYPENYGPYQGTLNQRLQQDTNLSNERSLGDRQKYQYVRKILKASFNTSKASLKALPFKDFIREIQEFYQPTGEAAKLLDFGCGSAQFLNEARKQGWDTLGMDFSEQAVEQASRNGHKALQVSPTVWNEIEDESLDFVRMNHVLEHLYHPKQVLTAIGRKMKPGAILHIAVPNPHGISSQIFRSQWWGLECPRHIMLYSPPVLKDFLIQLDFSNFKVFHESITKDFARSLGYFLCDRGRISSNEVETMMQRKFLSAQLYIPMKIAAICKAADRFHIFAKK